MKALIVDGYNVIHKIPYLKKITKKSLKLAREEITKLAKEYQRKCGGIDKVCVVFDGKSSLRDEITMEPANQVFSKNGEGDREVISLVRRLSRNYHVLVVTDDNYIRNNSRAHNASIIAISEFISLLTKQRKRVRKFAQIEKVDEKTALEINEELRKRWNV